MHAIPLVLHYGRPKKNNKQKKNLMQAREGRGAIEQQEVRAEDERTRGKEQERIKDLPRRRG